MSTMRWVSAILVVALLSTGASQAWAPESRPAPAVHEEDGFFAVVWEWLVSLIAGPGEPWGGGDPSSVQEKSGCGMDPDGYPNCT